MKYFSTATAGIGWIVCLVLFTPYTHAELPPKSNSSLRVMQHFAMNAEVELVMYGDSDIDPESLLVIGREVFAAVDSLEARISRWRKDSYTALVNREASKQPVVVATELMDLLLDSQRFYTGTGGVFDVTVGPLLERWGFYAGHGTLPTREELNDILERIGFDHVILNPVTRTVFFDQRDMCIDFGGIAKGLALDRSVAILHEMGVDSARMHMGTSTIAAVGTPPGEAGWTVDIRSPYNTTEDTYVATITICDEFLSTSGRTERYVEIDGRKYGHIIDPRTGMPAEGVLSVTAIAPTGVESDVLSTSFYILGLEATRSYCKLHPEVRAMFVMEQDDMPKTVFVNFKNPGN